MADLFKFLWRLSMTSWSKLARRNHALKLAEDPVYFAEVMLGAQLWSRQEEILRSVATHARTAVAACHASGKTFVTALLVLWWLAIHKQAIAVTTAPTWTQVQRLIWGEVHAAVNRSILK